MREGIEAGDPVRTHIKRAGQKPSMGEWGQPGPPPAPGRAAGALPPLLSRHGVTMTEELLLSSANGNKRSFLIMETGSGARANRTGSICNCRVCAHEGQPPPAGEGRRGTVAWDCGGSRLSPEAAC